MGLSAGAIAEAKMPLKHQGKAAANCQAATGLLLFYLSSPVFHPLGAGGHLFYFSNIAR